MAAEIRLHQDFGQCLDWPKFHLTGSRLGFILTGV